jgi:myosin protein heavy chain
MTPENHFDVRRVIEENTRVKTLKELEQEGKRAVKVVRASQMYDLITEAVERTIQSASMDMAEKQKLEVVRQSNEEFRRLIREREEERQRNAQREALLAQYEGEMRKLRGEVDRVARERADDQRKILTQRQTLEDSTVAEEKLRRERDTFHQEIAKLRTEAEHLGEKLRLETNARLEAERNVAEARTSASKSALEVERLRVELESATRTREEERKLVQSLRDSDTAWQKKVDDLQAEIRAILARREDEVARAEEAEKLSAQSAEELRALRSDLQKLMRDQESAEEQKRAQSARVSEYEKQIAGLQAEVRSTKENAMPPEMIAALLRDVHAIKSSFEQHAGVHPAAQAHLDEMMQRENAAISSMEKLFAEKMEKITKQVSNKLEDMTFKPKDKPVEAAKIVLDNLFRDETPMETNLSNVGIREQSGSGIGGALERLRSMHGAGTDPRDERSPGGEETREGEEEEPAEA